jgi:4-hydroxy-3-methylbut-2-enyl diphosphate reductase
MKITLSRYAGFCDGVARAFAMVEKIAKNPETKKPIFVLGSLIHNNDVLSRIESWGVRKLDLETLKKTSGKKIGTLVVTAHGVGPEIYALAKRKGINLMDTTCPRVMKVQRLAKLFSDRRYQIVIVGEKEHKEVKGIFGWSRNKARVVETRKELKNLVLNSKKKILVISQTTQNRDFVEWSGRYMQKKYPQAEVMGTICEATHNRQEEAKKMAKENDAMIVIGSPESANSTQLWKISKKINKKAYFIERASQLKKNWISGMKKIGVTAGASAPDWIIEEAVKYLKKA